MADIRIVECFPHRQYHGVFKNRKPFAPESVGPFNCINVGAGHFGKFTGGSICKTSVLSINHNSGNEQENNKQKVFFHSCFGMLKAFLVGYSDLDERFVGFVLSKPHNKVNPGQMSLSIKNKNNTTKGISY